MINRPLQNRVPLPDGTVLETGAGTFEIISFMHPGGAALIYQAQEEGQMYPVVLKEYFPGWGYVRAGAAVLPEDAAALPENSRERADAIEAMKKLFDGRAAREVRVGQEVRQRTRLTVSAERQLEVRSIRLPGEDPVTPPYCCILKMECLTERQGFWLKDLLKEAARPCSPEHPFGNGLQNRRSAVPQFSRTVELFCALLANLKRIHGDKGGSGCIHGDISAGNVFVDGSLSDGTVLGVSLLDFGGGLDAESKLESEVFGTPGFCAPELRNGGKPTPASDVYAVGRLFYALLDPVAANNLRLGKSLEFIEENSRRILLPGSAKSSGLEGKLLAEVNQLLTDAAQENPAKRITLNEMVRQMDEWRRRLTPPVWSLAQNAGALNDGEVKGRDEDVKNLLNELENEKRNPHVLWGFAGMGKTKMALAAAGEWQKRHPLGRTYFVRFPGTLEALYTTTFAQAMSVEAGSKKEELLQLVQKQLSQYLTEFDLLLIDNFDNDNLSWAELTGGSEDSIEQQLYRHLCALPCRVLLTTRKDLTAMTGGCFCQVKPLKEEVLLDILRDGAEMETPVPSEETLQIILELVNYHTMTVSMVAAVMRFNGVTAEKIADDLRSGQRTRDSSLKRPFLSEKDGTSRERSVLQNLTTLFDLANLTAPMQTLLRRAMFVGESGMPLDLFLNACDLRRDSAAFRRLVDLHYLNCQNSSEGPLLVLHTLIREVCSQQEPDPAEEDKCSLFLEGLWEFQQTPAERRSTADVYAAVLEKFVPKDKESGRLKLDTQRRMLWAYRAASLYFRLAGLEQANSWNDAMIFAEQERPHPRWELPRLYENRALIFRDQKEPLKELEAAGKSMAALKKLGALEQNPSMTASIYETLGRAYSDCGKFLLLEESPDLREKAAELTRCTDELAFGEDKERWAGRMEKKDYDARQRMCYEYAAQTRERRFTFHTSDTFRSYINLAYCAGVRCKNEPELLEREADRQLRYSQRGLDISERCSTGAYSNIGLAYRALEDYAHEREAFETLLERRRRNSKKGDSRLYELQALFYLIKACKHLEDFKKASELYDEAETLVKQLGMEKTFAQSLREAGEGIL